MPRSLGPSLATHRALALGLALLSPILAPLLGAGCGGDDATTGKRVTLHTTVTSKPGTYAARSGWSVELSTAKLAVASLHYFDGAPVVEARLDRIRALLLPSAHAHPGHYQEGTAIGQMLVPATVDLLAGSVQLADGDGVTGTLRSARLTLGAGTGDLAGRVAIVEGTASKDGTPAVHFRLVATPDELQKTAVDGKIEGCPFAPADVGGDGTVTVTVDPGRWFGFVDFEGVAPGTAEAPTEPAATDTARIGFVLGLGQAPAYGFSYTP